MEARLGNMATKTEINFKRLLKRCESMVSQKKLGDWRLEKYVSALQDQLTDMSKSPSPPTQEVMKNNTKNVEFLKGLIEAEKLPTASEKVMATDRLVPVSHGAKDMPGKELHLQAKVRHHTELRDELLGKKEVVENGLRQRKTGSEEDIDSVLQHHHQIQEKLAEEMVMLARNLKDTVSATGRIIRDDTAKVQDSSNLADKNYGKLKVESDRLEGYTKTCNWWIWIMLILVTLTFLWMILFMRLFSKKV